MGESQGRDGRQAVPAARPGFVRLPQRLCRDALIMGAGSRALRNNRNPSLERTDLTRAHLGLDPARVARRALGDGPLERFVAAHSPARPSRRLLARAAHHQDEDWAGADIEALDAERYEEPAVVAERVEKLLERVTGPIPVAELLGVRGSCHRMLHRYREAATEIALALEIADVAERDDVVARQARRAFTSEIDRGERESAAALAGAASSIYARLGDEEGTAATMINLATIANHTGEFERAVRFCSSALTLGLARPRNIFAAHQVRSAALVRLKRFDEAVRSSESAAAFLPRGRFLRGPQTWLAAQIYSARGEVEKANDHFAQAFTALPERIGDRLLIGAQWIENLLSAGDMAGASKLAQALCQLLEDLDRMPIKAARAFQEAVYELALGATRATLSRSVVSNALRAIERGRSVLKQDRFVDLI